MREAGWLPPGGAVFISRWHHGSPAHRWARALARRGCSGLQSVRCRAGEGLASDLQQRSHGDTGAAAHRYGLFGLHWLTEMDGQKITGEQRFSKAVLDLHGSTKFSRHQMACLHPMH